MDDISLGTLLGLLAVFLIVSAFFSISETSMMALNRYRLKHRAQTGHRGAKLTSQLLQKTDKLLSVILLGSNLLNAGAAALVTLIVLRLFGNHEWAITAGTLVLTFFLLVFTEITPKIIGAAYPEKIAYPASFVLSALLKLSLPVVWFINLFVRALLWILRLKPPAEGASQKLGIEELRMLVLEAGHFVPQSHKSILINLFDLEAITVDDIMIPRSEIEAIDLEATAESIREQLATCHHSRLVLYSGNLDEAAGVLDVRKALAHFEGEEIDGEKLRQLARAPYFIPAGTPLFSQLQHFKENHRRLGLVVDEYGELKGMVTLEDVVEEIVGEFEQPSPIHQSKFRQDEDGSLLVEGGTLIRDLNRKLGMTLPRRGPKTLNGLILEYFEDIPEAGTSLKISGYPMEIVQTEGRRVKMARIFPKLPAKP